MHTTKTRLGIGLIGSGFMGKAHAQGYTTAARTFDLPFALDLVSLADIDASTARQAADALGFRESTASWRDLLSNPSIDVINVATPNIFHAEMALAAIEAGKHVYCEKPLATTTADAASMADAAARRGVVTQVGFNYLKNPMLALARRLIAAGEIGEVRSFRGIHAEDYMADIGSPWTWRVDPRSGGGALADLGSHILATARFLLGPITELFADSQTLIHERATAAGERRKVEVDDVTRMIVRFENGASGTIEANWVATGRKMQHDVEVYGSKGGILFTQERFNELKLFSTDDRTGLQGFRTLCAGPEHPPYGAFCPAPGHQIGFNDLKAIEVRDFLLAIAGETGDTPRADFAEGVAVQRLVDNAYRSSRLRRWVHASDDPAAADAPSDASR